MHTKKISSVLAAGLSAALLTSVGSLAMVSSGPTFETLDTDADGALTYSEFMNSAGYDVSAEDWLLDWRNGEDLEPDFASLEAIEDGSEQRARLIEERAKAMTRFFAVADADDDGSLSPEEFKNLTSG